MKAQTLTKFASAALLTTALSAAMFLSAPAFADDDHARCQHKIEKAEAKLDDAVRKHGEHSRQAESRRRDLHEEREKCWSAYRGWWNGHERRWHDARDWDDDHHDHDDHH